MIKLYFSANMLQHKTNNQLLSRNFKKDVCPLQDGCCRCDELENSIANQKDEDDPNSIENFRGENAMFEDALQNKVFVQK